MISAGRGDTMELEIILVFHCNPCQFITKKNRLVAWTLASGKGGPLPPSQKSGGDVP